MPEISPGEQPFTMKYEDLWDWSRTVPANTHPQKTLGSCFLCLSEPYQSCSGTHSQKKNEVQGVSSRVGYHL